MSSSSLPPRPPHFSTTYLWSILTIPISAQLLLLLFAHMADWIPCIWVKAIFFLLFDLYDPLIIHHFHPFCCLLSTANPSALTLLNIIEIKYPTMIPFQQL